MALVCILIAGVAVSTVQAAPHVDKHARKIHHKLAKYSSGRYLHLVLRNDSDDYGVLGALAEDSFTFTSADNNTISTFSYDDVDRVRTDKEAIGEGSEPRGHIRHLIPIVITVAAVGAAGAIYAAER